MPKITKFNLNRPTDTADRRDRSVQKPVYTPKQREQGPNVFEKASQITSDVGSFYDYMHNKQVNDITDVGNNLLTDLNTRLRDKEAIKDPEYRANLVASYAESVNDFSNLLEDSKISDSKKEQMEKVFGGKIQKLEVDLSNIEYKQERETAEDKIDILSEDLTKQLNNGDTPENILGGFNLFVDSSATHTKEEKTLFKNKMNNKVYTQHISNIADLYGKPTPESLDKGLKSLEKNKNKLSVSNYNKLKKSLQAKTSPSSTFNLSSSMVRKNGSIDTKVGDSISKALTKQLTDTNLTDTQRFSIQTQLDSIKVVKAFKKNLKQNIKKDAADTLLEITNQVVKDPTRRGPVEDGASRILGDFFSGLNRDPAKILSSNGLSRKEILKQGFNPITKAEQNEIIGSFKTALLNPEASLKDASKRVAVLANRTDLSKSEIIKIITDNPDTLKGVKNYTKEHIPLLLAYGGSKLPIAKYIHNSKRVLSGLALIKNSLKGEVNDITASVIKIMNSKELKHEFSGLSPEEYNLHRNLIEANALYYRSKRNLNKGDSVDLAIENYQKAFTIVKLGDKKVGVPNLTDLGYDEEDKEIFVENANAIIRGALKARLDKDFPGASNNLKGATNVGFKIVGDLFMLFGESPEGIKAITDDKGNQIQYTIQEIRDMNRGEYKLPEKFQDLIIEDYGLGGGVEASRKSGGIDIKSVDGPPGASINLYEDKEIFVNTQDKPIDNLDLNEDFKNDIKRIAFSIGLDKIIVTSAYRKGSGKSQHNHKLAIDFSDVGKSVHNKALVLDKNGKPKLDEKGKVILKEGFRNLLRSLNLTIEDPDYTQGQGLYIHIERRRPDRGDVVEPRVRKERKHP